MTWVNRRDVTDTLNYTEMHPMAAQDTLHRVECRVFDKTLGHIRSHQEMVEYVSEALAISGFRLDMRRDYPVNLQRRSDDRMTIYSQELPLAVTIERESLIDQAADYARPRRAISFEDR